MIGSGYSQRSIHPSTLFLVLVISLFIGCTPPADLPDVPVGAETDSSYYFIFLNTNPDRPQISEDSAMVLQQLHMDTIGLLYEQGKLDVAGPFVGGGGIFILKAPDSTEARAYLDGDAAIRANRYHIELLPFDITAGSICKIDEDAEMVQYGFLRFREVIVDALADNPDQRESMLSSGELLLSGWFGNSNAGVMIVRSTSDSLLQRIASAHPGITNGHLKAELRQLWVGRGVFCE